MDGQDYLNQISAKSRPNSKFEIGGILSSKVFLIAVIGLVVFILIAIVGSMLGDGKDEKKESLLALRLHIDNTSKIIQKYQPIVRSSALRSSSASLGGVLSTTNRDLTAYIDSKYTESEEERKQKEKEKKPLATTPSETTLSNAEMAYNALDQDLFKAKITGTLDRTYALKMAYEIKLITTEETKVINENKDESLVTLLTSSYNSLENLYDKFNNFSESTR